MKDICGAKGDGIRMRVYTRPIDMVMHKMRRKASGAFSVETTTLRCVGRSREHGVVIALDVLTPIDWADKSLSEGER